MSVINLPNSGLGWDYRQSHNAPIPGAIGGYEHGGNQYLFLYQGSEFGVGDSHIHALKSTDLGLSWTDTGNINIPQIAGIDPFATPTYTTCMDGNTVYLMAVDLDGTNSGSDPHTGPILLFKYNLTSNTFGASSSVGGAPTVWKSWNGTTFSPRSGICLHLLLRGPGDMLLLYTDVETIGANKFARLAVATFNGTSCGAGVILAGQAGLGNPFTEKCAALDASHNLHVILASNDSHFWYHVAMDSGGSFGTFQTIETNAYFTNDTSNLLDFPAPADTIAFLGVRNRSSSHDNGDLAIYSAPGGSLSPTWTFHNLPSTANPVPDPVIAPDWIAALGYLDGTLHAFWTQTGIPPSWHVSDKMGEVRSSTASATDLTTWSAETSVMGPFDSGSLHWGAAQVAVWSGPGVGLGVLGNFEGFDSGGSGDPIEISKLTTVPPAGGGPPTVTCGSPPGGNVGTPYSHTMPNTHTGAFTVAVTAGALPHGLTMDSAGVITGTPTAAGTFVYTATITDSTSGLRSTRSFTPAIIAPSIQGYAIGNNIVGDFAFAHGGAFYAFLYQGGRASIGSDDVFGDLKIHAFKSTDSGVTWTEQNAGGAITPQICAGFGSPAYTVAVDGNTVYVLSLRIHAVEPGGAGIDGITVTSFNLTSGTWGTSVNYSTPLPGPWTNSGSAMVILQLVVRGAGDYLLYFSGPLQAGYGRVYYAPFNGTTFGASVMLPGQSGNSINYSASGAVCGTNGITQFIYFREGPNVYSVALNSSGSFGSVQTVSTASTRWGNNWSMPRLYTQGGSESVLLFGWIDDNNDPAFTQSLRGYHAPVVLNPAWTETYICLAADDTDRFTGPFFTPTHAPCDQTFSGFCRLFTLTVSGTRAVAIWAVTKQLTASPETTIGEFWYCEADTATFTWTAPAVLFRSGFPGVQPFPGDPTRDAYLSAATQVVSFDGGSGAIGVIGCSLDQALAQAAESIFLPGSGTDSATCTITISAPTIGLGCASPPDGVVGVPYLHAFPVSGGVPPLTFAITSGILPPGLTLDSSNGEVSGTPTLAGDYEFVIQVSDDFGSTVGTCDIVITVTDLPVSDIGCGSPPGGEIGVSYSHTFPVTDIPSGATVTYAITGGALPPGLTLNTSTGQVTGTPTTDGHYHFTVTATIT